MVNQIDMLDVKFMVSDCTIICASIHGKMGRRYLFIVDFGLLINIMLEGIAPCRD
jgi:hypothetical protein